MIDLNVRKVCWILLLMAMLFCVSCQWQLKLNGSDLDDAPLKIERYDRIETLYLTTGDYSALQQMNTSYPMQTRMLIEDMLRIGKVDDPEINTKFLRFFQDSTLQTLLSDVQQQFADIEDLNTDLSAAFAKLREELPDIDIPQIYTQIGSFDQSIVVGNNTLGISLDKYLGVDYPFYRENYTDEQRQMMVRSMIVPDCLGFYLLSLYPLPHYNELSQAERDHHMGKIQWVVNHVMGRMIFTNEHVDKVGKLMNQNNKLTIDGLLSSKSI